MIKSIRGGRLAAALGWPLLLPATAWAGGICQPSTSSTEPVKVGVEYVSTACPATDAAPIRYQRVTLQCREGRLEQGPELEVVERSPQQLRTEEASANEADQGVINRLGTQALFIDRQFKGFFALDESGQGRAEALPLSGEERCGGPGEPPSLDHLGCHSEACLDAVEEGKPAINPGWQGNLFHMETDLRAGPGSPIRFNRYYNSQPLVLPFDPAARRANVALLGFEFQGENRQQGMRQHQPRLSGQAAIARGELGGGWRSSLSRRVVAGELDGRSVVAVVRDDGKSYLYERTGSGNRPWVGSQLGIGRLEEQANGWSFIADDGEIEQYDKAGRLLSLAYPDSQRLSLSYDDKDLPQTVRNERGVLWTLSYDQAARLAQLKDFRGINVSYAWQGQRLQNAYPDERAKRAYLYQDTAPRLESIAAEAHTLGSYRYDDQGRVTEGRQRGEDRPFRFDYAQADSPVLHGADGTVTRFAYLPSTTLRRLASVQVECVSRAYGCIDSRSRYQYDARGWLLESEESGGARRVRYQYSANGFESLHQEFAAGRLLQTTATQWDAGLRRPLTRYLDNVRSDFSYDVQGRLMLRRVKGDGIDESWRYFRDTAGRQIGLREEISPRQGEQYSYGYDGAGNLVSMGLTQGHGRNWSRDSDGRVTGRSSLPGELRFRYDRAGRLNGYDSLDFKLTLRYDPYDRLIEAGNGIATLSYRYDENNDDLIEIRSATGAYRHYAYLRGADGKVSVEETSSDPAGEIATVLAQIEAAHQALGVMDMER